MNLYHLRYFSLLAKTQNYTQAAQKLNITQPSLSNAIHTLERELDVNLFEKRGRNVFLTPAGHEFVEDVDQCLATLDTGVAKIQKRKQRDRIIRVAALRTLSTNWLPRKIHDFLTTSDYPSTQFKLTNVTGLSPDIIKGLREENYDICFCSKIDDQDDIDYIPISRNRLVVITPLNHPLAKRTSLNLKETLPYDQVTFSERTGLHPIMERLFSDCGGRPKSVYSIEEDQAVAGLVANGFGIAVVPYMPILARMPVKVIPLSFPKWERVIYMATLKKHYQNKVTQAFVQFITDSVSQQVPS